MTPIHIPCPHCGHSYSPDSSPAASDLREILAGITRLETLMSQLSTDEQAIGAKIATLQTNLTALIASIPGQISAALAAAGSDDATVDTALQALGPVLDSMNAAVTAATPAPAAPAQQPAA